MTLWDVKGWQVLFTLYLINIYIFKLFQLIEVFSIPFLITVTINIQNYGYNVPNFRVQASIFIFNYIAIVLIEQHELTIIRPS